MSVVDPAGALRPGHPRRAGGHQRLGDPRPQRGELGAGGDEHDHHVERGEQRALPHRVADVAERDGERRRIADGGEHHVADEAQLRRQRRAASSRPSAVAQHAVDGDLRARRGRRAPSAGGSAPRSRRRRGPRRRGSSTRRTTPSRVAHRPAVHLAQHGPAAAARRGGPWPSAAKVITRRHVGLGVVAEARRGRRAASRRRASW